MKDVTGMNSPDKSTPEAQSATPKSRICSQASSRGTEARQEDDILHKTREALMNVLPQVPLLGRLFKDRVTGRIVSEVVEAAQTSFCSLPKGKSMPFPGGSCG